MVFPPKMRQRKARARSQSVSRVLDTADSGDRLVYVSQWSLLDDLQRRDPATLYTTFVCRYISVAVHTCIVSSQTEIAQDFGRSAGSQKAQNARSKQPWRRIQSEPTLHSPRGMLKPTPLAQSASRHDASSDLNTTHVWPRNGSQSLSAILSDQQPEREEPQMSLCCFLAANCAGASQVAGANKPDRQQQPAGRPQRT